MGQKVAKIQNALKTEYADFANFCKLSDKQFVHELTMSDYIAFRTQMGVTREYVAGIQRLLADYDPAEEELEEQPEIVMECPAIDPSAPPDPSTDKLKEQYPSITSSPAANEGIVINETGESQVDSEQFISKDSTPPERENQLNGQDSSNSAQSIYMVFGISEDPSFTEQNINTLELSTRALNCLNRNHCHTLDALFSKSVNEVEAFKNLGRKTLSEIIEACRAFSGHPANPEQDNDALPSLDGCKTGLNSIAESIARGLDYDFSALTIKEQKYAKKLEEAYEILGGDLSLTALETPMEIRPICLALLYLKVSLYSRTVGRRPDDPQGRARIMCSG